MTNTTLRKITVKKGSTAKSLFDECKKLFKIYSWINLSNVTSDRKTTKTYSIWVNDTVEVDEDLRNKSANDILKEGIQTITLEERLQMEIDYFKETGKHLDVMNFTLCSGSRDANGRVPSVDWDETSGRVGVDAYYPRDASDYLRPRAVFLSPESSPLNLVLSLPDELTINGFRYGKIE